MREGFGPWDVVFFFWTEHLVGHTGLSIIWSASTMALKYKMFILALHAKNASPYCSFYPWGLFYFGRKLEHIYKYTGGGGGIKTMTFINNTENLKI